MALQSVIQITNTHYITISASSVYSGFRYERRGEIVILQTSPELDRQIKKNGCYFMSILFLAGQKSCQSFHTEDIMRIKDEAIKKGYLKKDCFVDDPEGIFSLAGLPVQYTDTHEPPSRIAESDELEILYYRWSKDGHFVAGKDGLVAYDPMGMSNSVQLGELQSKRIFKVL